MKQSIYGNKHNYQKELERVKKSLITDRNKQLLEDFHNYCFGTGLSAARVVKLSWILRKLAMILDKDFDVATKDDILRINKELNLMDNYSPETLNDYRKALKKFFKWLKGTEEGFPPEVSWLKSSSKLKDRKLVGRIITPDEIKKAIEVCTNDRDRAFISLLYESGCRIAEMLNIQIKDFQFLEKFAKLTVSGKTGERRIPIISSVPFICNYLKNHIHKDNPDGFVWISESSYHKDERINYVGAVRLLRRVFKRAGIQKKVNPHIFRHSRATELASHLTEVQMCLYFGWVLGSGMTRVYVHANGRETDDAMLRYYGIKKDEDNREERNLPIECSICKVINEFTNKFCKNCGKALTVKTALDVEHHVKTETNNAFELMLEITKSPELLREFEEFRKAQQEIIT